MNLKKKVSLIVHLKIEAQFLMIISQILFEVLRYYHKKNKSVSLQEQSRSLRSRYCIRIKQAVVGGSSLARLARTTLLLPKVAVNIASRASYGNAPLCRGCLAPLNGRLVCQLLLARLAVADKPSSLKKAVSAPSGRYLIILCLVRSAPYGNRSASQLRQRSALPWLPRSAQRSLGLSATARRLAVADKPSSLRKAVSAPSGRSLIIYRSSAPLPTRKNPPRPVGRGGER